MEDDVAEFRGRNGAVFEPLEIKSGSVYGTTDADYHYKPYSFGERLMPCRRLFFEMVQAESMGHAFRAIRPYLSCISVSAMERREEQIALGLIKPDGSVRVTQESGNN